MPTHAPLAYAPGRAPFFRRRRVRLLFWLVVAALILGGAYFLAYPPIERRLEYLRAQRQWMTLDRAPTAAPFDENWTTTRDGSSHSRGSSFESAHYQLRQTYRLPNVAAAATLFLHARKPAGGPERLVIVEFEPGPSRPPAVGSPLTLTLRWYTGTPATWLSDPAGHTAGAAAFVRPPIAATGHTRFFNGQPDPADPAAFTLAYQVDGAPGVLAGRLKDDGTVDLSPTAGPLAPAP